MIVAAAAAVCAILMPLVGGRLSSLAELRLRHEGVVLGLFVLQAVLRGRLPGLDGSSVWAIAIWGAACLALILVLLPSRGLPGVVILMLGLGSNLWVTLLNHGMPYMTTNGAPVASAGRFYHLVTSATSFAWMGDVMPEPTSQWLLSFGDILLFVGVVAVVLHGSTVVSNSSAAGQ